MRYVTFIVIIGSLLSCIQEPETAELVQYMLVQTHYNKDFVNENSNAFDTYSKFVIREDTMGYVSTTSNKEYIIENDVPGFVKPVVGAIRDGFVNEGYTQVTFNDNPDFAVNVIVLVDFQYYQTINYGGYGYPGSYYYGYYGYYYPIVSTYYSNYATLLIQVVGTTQVSGEYPIIWSAYIGDLNQTLDLKTKTLEAVATAFEQSSYLKKK